MQETALLTARDFDQFRGATEPELLAWLRQILANVVATFFRHYRADRRDVLREQGLQQTIDKSSAAIAGKLCRLEPSPSQHAIRRERVVILADALAELPDHYREVLILRDFQGLTFPEIAAQLGNSVSSVEKLP